MRSLVPARFARAFLILALVLGLGGCKTLGHRLGAEKADAVETLPL
jgi:hypothetical protein